MYPAIIGADIGCGVRLQALRVRARGQGEKLARALQGYASYLGTREVCPPGTLLPSCLYLCCFVPGVHAPLCTRAPPFHAPFPVVCGGVPCVWDLPPMHAGVCWWCPDVDPDTALLDGVVNVRDHYKTLGSIGGGNHFAELQEASVMAVLPWLLCLTSCCAPLPVCVLGVGELEWFVRCVDRWVALVCRGMRQVAGVHVPWPAWGGLLDDASTCVLWLASLGG